MAAAVALAEGSELHPQVVGDALERTIALYNGGDEAARAGEHAASRLLGLRMGVRGVCCSCLRLHKLAFSV